MTRIFLARHGQTEGNKSGRLEARLDSPLTDQGRAQVAILASRLKEVQLDAIYSSPSLRAVRTAETIRGTRTIPITTTPKLSEIDIGAWDGHTPDEIRQMDPVRSDQFFNHPENYYPEHAESFTQLKQRVISFLQQITPSHTNQTILVVSHSGVIKMLLDHIRLIPLDRYWEPPSVPNGSLSCIRIEPTGSVVEFEADTQTTPIPAIEENRMLHLTK